MAYSTKKAPFVLWLTIPFAVVCSMLYVVVVLIMTDADADAINILTDDNPGITTTAKKGYRYTTYNNTEKVAPGERLHAICRKGAYVLVDKANGNRIAVEKENLDLDVTELPYYNSGFEYYVRGGKDGELFIGKHINDVVKEVGSYNYCNKQTGTYEFAHVTLVDGKNKYSCWTLITDRAGVIKEASFRYESWNLYGILPFYDSIVPMNIFSTRCSGILGDRAITWYELIVFFLLMATPIATFVPKKKEIGDTRLLPSVFVYVYGIYSFVIEYILIISFVEFSHRFWLITLPLAIVVAFFFSIVQISLILSNVAVYCDKCGAKNSLYTTREKLGETYAYEYVSRTKEGNRVKYKGYDLNSGEEIWEGSRRTRTTRCKVTRIKYLVETCCKNCGYYSSREVTEEIKGPEERVSVTREKTTLKEV